MESVEDAASARQGERQGEDEVARLQREKEETAAALARAQDELRKAWEEMQEAWELREDEEERLRQLLARLEARNADLELRDKELRGDLARLADAETALAHARLLQKLVYKAFHKGFLNDEEADEDETDQRASQPVLPPELLARQQELNEIEAFVQRKRQERAARDGGPHKTSLGAPSSDPPSLTSSGNVVVSTSSASSSLTSSHEEAEDVTAAGAGSLEESKQAATAASTPEVQAEQKKHDRAKASAVPTVVVDNHTQASEREEGGGSGVKGRVTKAALVGASKAVIQPPPAARASQRASMKKPEDAKSGRAGTVHHAHQPSGPAQPIHHSSGAASHHPGPHHHSHHGHGQGHGHVKHHPTTLQDLFVATPAPSSPPEAHGSPRGHSRSRSMGHALAGIVAGAVPSEQNPTAPPHSQLGNTAGARSPMPTRVAQVPRLSLVSPPQPPPLPPAFVGKPDKKKSSKIEREIDEYCGQGLNEVEDEDEKVPVAAHRLAIKLREDNFFVPTTNRAFIKTCNTLLVHILKAISSCVKMSKRDIKAQAFWLSYTTSFICLLKQETKGKLEGMRQIRNPRKHGIQLISANKLIKKITNMPETSTEYILLSRRIEICGFACKLLQITQRVYSNLLRLITKQLEPLLIPVVFYHERSTGGVNPFMGAQSSLSSSSASGILASPRGPSASPVREHTRPTHSASSSSLGAGSSARGSTIAPGGGGLSRSTSSSFLSTLAIANTNPDYSCTKTGNDILLVLSRMFYNLMSNNVYCTIVQQFFTQTYHVMDAALFNHLIDNARNLATVANALAVKSMLSQLTAWRRRTNLLHRKSKQFAHIREALNVLSISKAMFLEVDTAQAFSHLNDLQILHLLVNFQPDELAPEPVPGKVKLKLQERSQQSAKDMTLHIDPALMFTYKRKKSKPTKSQ